MADAEVICDISCGATHDGAVVRCSFMSTDYDIVPGERALMHCAMAALRLIGDQILLGFIMPFRVDTRTPVLAATAFRLEVTTVETVPKKRWFSPDVPKRTTAPLSCPLMGGPAGAPGRGREIGQAVPFRPMTRPSCIHKFASGSEVVRERRVRSGMSHSTFASATVGSGSGRDEQPS